MWVRVALLMACAVGVLAVVPKCDPAITSKMAQFHPDGPPKNIMQSLMKNGLYSYVVVSSDEGTFLGLGVRCIGISIPDDRTAQVSYKLSIFPRFNLKFPVREENGILYQKDGMEYKLYVIYISDAGVIFTYRCCDGCTATAPNTGIAVADALKNNPATKAAFATARAKMAELGLDKDVVDLPYCT